MNYVITWEKIVKVKVFGFILLISFVLGLTGCGTKYPELEKDAVGFKMSSYIDETDDDAEYSAIEYNGRTYVACGTAKGTVNGKISHEEAIKKAEKEFQIYREREMKEL